jgi:crotonobetainyl-CoA:carnitine CoA-transferase CaiB-like acyl-CoA transferase
MLHVALGDPVAGVTGAAALVLALLHQQRTGEGQLVDLSQVEAMSTLGLHALADTVLGREPRRLGNRHPVSAPHGLYPCAGDDQWVAIAVESDAQWASLCEQVGDPELAVPAYTTAEGRRQAHDAIDARLAAWSGSRERNDLARDLAAAGIPASAVYDVDEVLAHEQLLSRGFWHWVEREIVGVQPHPSAPYRTGPEPFGIDRPAPTLGEHSHRVLSELLGLGDRELADLERMEVIGTLPRPPG